jgi:hypothetical protein
MDNQNRESCQCEKASCPCGDAKVERCGCGNDCGCSPTCNCPGGCGCSDAK